jgi:hypothetical protein
MNKTKQIYCENFEGTDIIVRCIYYGITGKISVIKDLKNTYKHSKKESKYTPKRGSVCEILTQHEHELKNDSERLSLDFLQGLIGTKC